MSSTFQMIKISRWFGLSSLVPKDKYFLAEEDDNNASPSKSWTDDKDTKTITASSCSIFYEMAAKGDLKEFEKLYRSDPSRLNIQDSKGNTPLHHAVLKGQQAIIKFIVANNGDLNAKDNDGNTPLHLAVEQCNVEIIDFLLENKADPSVRNKADAAPIHLAIITGLPKAVEAMVKHESVDVNIMGGDNGAVPLHYCAHKDRHECARILLENGAKMCSRCAHGFSPVHLAAKCASPKCLEVFIKCAEQSGISREQVLLFEDKEHNTPLHAAVNSGDVEAVEVCLNAGAPVDAQQVDKSTPLHFACAQGSLKMIQMMYTKQLDRFNNALQLKDAVDMVPLHRAAQYNHVDIVEYLLEKGADCNSTDNQNRTPMLLAASKSGLQTVKTLIEHGASIEIRDIFNRNFLHLAIKSGATFSLRAQTACCKEFLNQLNEQDDFGCTPLHYASKAGYVSAIGDLLRLGAQINSKNKENESPFHFAAKYGRYNTCLKLLNSAHGSIIINETDGNSQTGLHIAAANGHNKIVSLLLERGAVVTRDADSNTPLHLAAANGYTKCITLLHRFHANLLESQNIHGDTPLHVAAKNGQPAAVRLFMSGEALFSKNKEGCTFFDCAIDNMQTDVALEIVQHDRWEEAMSLKSTKYGCVMLGLVQVMPDICMAVLDRCQVPSNHDTKSKEFHLIGNYGLVPTTVRVEISCSGTKAFQKMMLDSGITSEEAGRYFVYCGYATTYLITYNFKFLQCPLAAMKQMEKKGEDVHPMIALNRMVQYGRVNCLSHPVSVVYLKMKWKAYGCFLYMFNFLIYIVFLAMLTYFGSTCDELKPKLAPEIPVNMSSTTESAAISSTFDNRFGYMQKTSLIVMATFCSLNFLKEFFQMYQQKLKYFLDATNLLEWVLYVNASIYIFPLFCGETSDTQAESAAIAMFLAWFNCLLYLQRFDFFGLYVVMFLEILKTLLQVVFVFSILFVAFGLSFYILLSQEETMAYSTPGLSIVRSAVMMLEIDYMDSFNKPFNDGDPNTLHFGTLSMILLMVFILLMPILLINLLIGLAVGDIESVQRNARLKRLAMQVELHTEFERKLPLKLLEKVDKVTYKVYPRCCKGFLSTMVDRMTTSNISSQPGADRVSPENQFIMEEMYKQKKKMKDMSQTIQRQYDLVRLIVQKMEIQTEDDNQDEGSPVDNCSISNCGVVAKCNSAVRRGVMKQQVVSKWKKRIE